MTISTTLVTSDHRNADYVDVYFTCISKGFGGTDDDDDGGEN